MKTLLPLIAAALIAGAGPGLAQGANSDAGGQSPPKASAPAESSHAPGHDVQTGHPESGEIQRTAPHAGSGQTKTQAETAGGAATPRLDSTSGSGAVRQ